jgi:hypothetical protein
VPLARRWLACAAVLAVAATPFATSSHADTGAPLVPAGYVALVGPLHEHSGYSDGWAGSTPATYYASAKKLGNDFLLSGDHSDTLDAPIAANDTCAGPGVSDCLLADPDPVKSFTKWDATEAYAKAATDASFTAGRGFEWTSDRFGHISVYFSRNKTNAKIDGGYASMDTFYSWLTRRPEAGGGLDGLAVFNHPDAKKLQVVGGSDPGVNWNDFAYVSSADRQMVAAEVYNDDDQYGQHFSRILDKGWHVGAVGAEDLGHRRTDDWGGPTWAKTVILSRDRSESALQEAMQARRFYAVRRPDTRLGFTVDGAVMGSRLARQVGAPLTIAATGTRTGHSGLTLQVVTSGGRVVATGTDAMTVTVPTSGAEKYYFLRVTDGTEVVGISSPVWVERGLAAPVGEWLAGDLHVHTCYSHDAYCGPDDDNTGPEDFYTAGGSPTERFAEAAARGLDYLALTDHHSDSSPQDSGFDSVQDPGFGSAGVIGLPGYENSIAGHAQMLGAKRIYPSGDGSDAAINAMADALRADGGLFQANHPAEDETVPLTDCRKLPAMHWSYGLRVPVDTVEVWNVGHHLQLPLPAGMSNADSVRYWECWLNTGAHVTPTGGSDSHWLSTAAVQGVGNPTTWVFAQERSARGVLEAMKAGRTSISFQPPAEGAPVLLLEGDVDRDGVYEAMVGDTVPPKTPLRVRATGTPGAGLVDVRANGRTIVEGAALTPGGTIDFTLDEPGWVWASVYAEDGVAQRRATCEPLVGDQTSYCRNRITMLGMTSALYVAEPVVVPPPVLTPLCPTGQSPKPRPSANPHGDKCRKE